MEKKTVNASTNNTETILGKLLAYHSISFRKLADAIGTTAHPYLFRLAKGQANNPNLDIAVKISNFFKISIPQFLGEEKIDFDNRPKDLNMLNSVDYNKSEDKQITNQSMRI